MNGLFPERTPIFDLVRQYKELFPEDFKKSYPFKTGGYLLFNERIGGFWGTSEQNAYYLFVNRKEAEVVQRAIDFDGSWEIMEVGIVKLDSDRWKTSGDLNID